MMASTHIERILASLVGRGQPPAHPLGREVVASWKRCVDEYHLEPNRMAGPQVLTATELKSFREPLGDLIALARPELDRLHRRLIHDDYVVLLGDEHGITVDFRLAQPLEADARRAGLYLGSIWDERGQGTNGIGTCLRTARPVSIVQDDHFAPYNAGLTCTVAPIHGPTGEIVAVLDVSTARTTDHARQRLVLDVVLNSVRRLENRIFRRCFHDAGASLVQLSPDHEFLDAAEECLLAVDAAGRVVGADRQALGRLEQRPVTEVLGRKVEAVLRLGESELLATARSAPVDLSALSGARGRLFARLLPSTRPLRSCRAGVARHQSRQDGPDLATLAGGDPRMRRAVATALRLIDVGLPILLMGETGSGKGAFAEALHRSSARAARPFVAINCAALPEPLIESELFGYQPGAFTGAARTGAQGKLLEAQGGTLFLDEIGDMPAALQTRLLRTLSEGDVTPLGGTGRAVKLDVAVIAATHQPLDRLIAERRFREDLYFRLAGATLHLPPLRDRADRAELIARVFAEEAGAQGSQAKLVPAAMALLKEHFWPGNIRELRHAARYAVALCDGEAILPEHLPPSIRGPRQSSATDDDGPTALELALDRCDWNMTAAARLLGVSRATIHRRVRDSGLRRP